MKNTIKSIIIGSLMIFSLSSCYEDTSSDGKLAEQTESLMAEANAQIGMPAIVNFQERKLMKMILELRDQENLICYAYIIDMNGNKHFLGQCVGYGLPYSVQYTNPQKIKHDNSSARIAVPQADPNGLFMPTGLSATWLMLIDPKTGDPHPIYVEPELLVSPFKLH